MLRYIIKRMLLIIPVVFLVTFTVYFLLDLAPGDAADIMATEDMSKEEIEILRESMGLNEPLLKRYFDYMGGVLRGDLGNSIRNGAPVWDQYIARLPTTAKLAFASELVTLAIAIPFGILAARKKDSWIDFGATTFNLLGLSIPNFWLGLLFILWFAVQRDWFPAAGNEGWISFVLPAIVVGTGNSAILGRTCRSAMLDVLRQDYLRTARAKGCSERTVVYKHAFRNAQIPISTIMFSQLAALFGGTATTETTFALPGVAQLCVQSIRNNDYPMVTGCVVMTTTIATFCMVLMDIFIAYMDPRVKAKYSK